MAFDAFGRTPARFGAMSRAPSGRASPSEGIRLDEECVLTNW
jgi:hypothetical protein